jgi:UDP-N-acetylmuramate: L-alanyl-gamma-D-glutamyl-meso-diaminopimelate ligase
MSKPKVHFIAVGGAVMHNLALALKKKGFEVSGSDDEIYDPAKSRLAAAGILPEAFGWFPEKINAGLDAIILGMHARKDNPELLKAQELGLKVYSFPEYVFEQSQNKKRVVIAGSHGKTSITSVILHVLAYHKKDFDYLVGAQIEGFDLMVKLTEEAPIIVIEGDEYLSSPIEMKSKFLFYHPHVTLISGISWDHFNVFPTYDKYVGAFEELCADMIDGGELIYDKTDAEVLKVGSQAKAGLNQNPYEAHPYRVENGKTILMTPKGELEIKLFGEHNMKNLNGAKIVLSKIGINEEEFYEAVPSFSGASKRLESMGHNDHTHVYRDFAHAPSKVGATTKATKEIYPDRRLIACYELHTYSSLNKDFLPLYENTLNSADTAIVFFSPHTLAMKKMPALSKEEIKDYFNREDVIVMTEKTELSSYLKAQSWSETNLLFMSSGTFDGLDFKLFAEEILGMKTP